MTQSQRQLLTECQARHEERRARREAIAADCAAHLYSARASLHRARLALKREWDAMLDRVRGLRGEEANP